MEVLNNISNRTDSVLLLLIIVLIVGTVVGLPMYKTSTKAREKKRDQYLAQTKQLQEQQEKREERLLEVIQNNSTVISELSTIMKNNQRSCDDCKAEQVVLYKELNEKQELMNTTLEVIRNNLPKAIKKVRNKNGLNSSNELYKTGVCNLSSDPLVPRTFPEKDPSI